jgi:hypothetical protein
MERREVFVPACAIPSEKRLANLLPQEYLKREEVYHHYW